MLAILFVWAAELFMYYVAVHPGDAQVEVLLGRAASGEDDSDDVPQRLTRPNDDIAVASAYSRA